MLNMIGFSIAITEKRQGISCYPRPNYDKPKSQLRNNCQKTLYIWKCSEISKIEDNILNMRKLMWFLGINITNLS